MASSPQSPPENPSPPPPPPPSNSTLPPPETSTPPPSSNSTLPPPETSTPPPSSNSTFPPPETSTPPPSSNATLPPPPPPETSTPPPPPPSTNSTLPLPPPSKKPSPLTSPPLSPSQTLAIVVQPDYLTNNNSEPNPNGSSNLTIGTLLTMSDLAMAKVLTPPPHLPLTVRLKEMRRVELGLRVSAMVLCLISFAFMAADSVPGWDGDSFSRYAEYLYLLSINVIGCAYSLFQVIDEIHQTMKGKHFISHPIGFCFNLAMDQILAYLLLSSSSASTSQISIWISRFGSDDFTKMVNASVSVSFFAFLVFAMSSVLSARNLFSSVS